MHGAFRVTSPYYPLLKQEVTIAFCGPEYIDWTLRRGYWVHPLELAQRPMQIDKREVVDSLMWQPTGRWRWIFKKTIGTLLKSCFSAWKESNLLSLDGWIREFETTTRRVKKRVKIRNVEYFLLCKLIWRKQKEDLEDYNRRSLLNPNEAWREQERAVVLPS